MYIIVGLGNPGREYENTKHNIGFITVDQLAARHGISVSRLKHRALTGDGRIGGKKVLLVKPQTYMNASGESVAAIAAYFDVDISEIIVIYDDVDIPMGSLRIRKSGSAGSHNGMRDIIYQLNADGFPRVRLGIGGDRGRIPLRDYVLGGFSRADVPLMEQTVLRAADAVEAMLSEGVDFAMNRYNG
jgi:PTH1 family peptidyl-tRNA hydrolase